MEQNDPGGEEFYAKVQLEELELDQDAENRLRLLERSFKYFFQELGVNQ